MSQKADFIKRVADAVQAYAPTYGIRVHSPVIAQAILESGWGESKLSSRYHNHFGLKAGTQWSGRSVDLQTREFYDGREVTIVDSFRVYRNFDEGVRGYFEFVQKPRYANLKEARTPEEYCRDLVKDGYATDPGYADSLLRLIDEYDLDVYDPGAHVATSSDGSKTIVRPGETAQALIDAMRSFLGYSEADGSYRQVIDLYNSQRPLPRGYKVSYDDPWCAATVSAAAVKAGLTNVVPTECSCEELVKRAVSMGIWIEDGSITPEPGDIVLYNWDESEQPNDGFSDHVGVVERVSGGAYTVIEGNYQDKVGTRTVPVGWGYVRGFARPSYAKAAPAPADPVAPGLGGPSSEPSWTGYVLADALNVRCWAGTEYPNILSYPVLYSGNQVDVCDTASASDGSEWYYVRIAGRIYGFVSAAYIGRV